MLIYKIKTFQQRHSYWISIAFNVIMMKKAIESDNIIALESKYKTNYKLIDNSSNNRSNSIILIRWKAFNKQNVTASGLLYVVV
jgi:hypothetical protein